MAVKLRGEAEKEAFVKFEAWVRKDVHPSKTAGNRRREAASKIDPSEEQDWYSLSLGFFAALGLGNAACHRLALHACYDMQYWR